MEAKRQSVNPLQQRVVEIACNLDSLTRPFLRQEADPPCNLAHTQTIHEPQQSVDQQPREDLERQCLIERRGDFNPEWNKQVILRSCSLVRRRPNAASASGE